MGAYTMLSLAPLAVHAQHLEPLREVVFDQPTVEVRADASAVICPVIIDVIDGEEGRNGLSTASTGVPTVCGEHLILEDFIPAKGGGVVLFSTGTTVAFGDQRCPHHRPHTLCLIREALRALWVAAWRAPQGSQLESPSRGGGLLPQKMHKPASRYRSWDAFDTTTSYPTAGIAKILAVDFPGDSNESDCSFL